MKFFNKKMSKNRCARSFEKNINSVINFRRVTHFRLCLLETQVHGILEPLRLLGNQGRIDTSKLCVLVVDALCEADQLRPDFGDTLASFLVRHLLSFPPWLKLVCALRSNQQELSRELPFHRVSLDNTDSDERISKDVTDYIKGRVAASTSIAANIGGDGEVVNRLTQHLVTKVS